MRITARIAPISFCLLVWANCSDEGPLPPTTDGPLSGDSRTIDAGPSVDVEVPADDPCPNDPNAPMDEVLYGQHILKATSNGSPTSFTKSSTPVLEHASEGDAIVRPDGKTWIYFMNTIPGQRGIFVADWDGDKFTTFDCVRFNGKVPDTTADPDIVLQADGRYRIFYSEFRKADRPQGQKRGIYTATSTDGVHFDTATRVIEFDEAQAPTAVQQLDGSWLMAIAGTHGATIRLATSTDGAKTFQVTGKEWPTGVPELAIFPDGTLRLYYGSSTGLVIERSDDQGASWQAEATGPGVTAPSLVHNTDGTWTIYYKGVATK